MTMKLYTSVGLIGDYDLRELDTFHLSGTHAMKVGLVRIAKGVRSPLAGLRTGADHEIGYVVSGKVRVETQSGHCIASEGDVRIASPDIPHAIIALEDTVIFFTLAFRGSMVPEISS
jgi:quercetin dioxygenase-like cupin family protein